MNRKLEFPLLVSIVINVIVFFFPENITMLLSEYWHYWILYTVGTWIAFVAGMTIKLKYKFRGQTRIGKVADWLFKYLLDMQCNWFISAFPFLNLPASLTELVTDRMIRYKQDRNMYFAASDVPKSVMYRYKLAVQVCWKLEEIDPGHCAKK